MWIFEPLLPPYKMEITYLQRGQGNDPVCVWLSEREMRPGSGHMDGDILPEIVAEGIQWPGLPATYAGGHQSSSQWSVRLRASR